MSLRTRIVVVTGVSGAGKSTVLHALEDLGFFCVDNLPTSLVENVVQECEAGGLNAIALGIHARVGSFLQGAVEALEKVGRGDRDVTIAFLDASDEALLRRFSESRRPHPIKAIMRGSIDGTLAIVDGVKLERERLAPLRARAAIDLDTTRLSVHELRRRVIEHFGPGKSEQPRMVVRLVSFGYKYGVPLDADLIFDVRFLDNPFFVEDLRDLPGTDPKVMSFLLKNPETSESLARIEQFLFFALPRYEREGKSYLTIGVGCTGGRHRSVALASILGETIAKKAKVPLSIVHRDVARADALDESQDDAIGEVRGTT